MSTPNGVRLVSSSTFIQPSVVHKRVDVVGNSLQIEEELVIDET